MSESFEKDISKPKVKILSKSGVHRASDYLLLGDLERSVNTFINSDKVNEVLKIKFMSPASSKNSDRYDAIVTYDRKHGSEAISSVAKNEKPYFAFISLYMDCNSRLFSHGPLRK
jgi:hypothetical protein